MGKGHAAVLHSVSKLEKFNSWYEAMTKRVILVSTSLVCKRNCMSIVAMMFLRCKKAVTKLIDLFYQIVMFILLLNV